MDFYYLPDEEQGAPKPAVILVTGYSDDGAKRTLGCRFKEMGAFISWAELLAASGMVAVTYANHDPADVHLAIRHVRGAATTYGIDQQRLGLWACSGHGPNALSVLMQHPGAFKCTVLLYPYTLDSGNRTHVADAAGQFHFVNATAGKGVDDLRCDVALFVARAGCDQMPGLNDALDRFVGNLLARNQPLTVVNHATGPHAFDLFDDSDASREVIRRALGFLRWHLVGCGDV
jgi:hypothetical protein